MLAVAGLPAALWGKAREAIDRAQTRRAEKAAQQASDLRRLAVFLSADWRRLMQEELVLGRNPKAIEKLHQMQRDFERAVRRDQPSLRDYQTLRADQVALNEALEAGADTQKDIARNWRMAVSVSWSSLAETLSQWAAALKAALAAPRFEADRKAEAEQKQGERIAADRAAAELYATKRAAEQKAEAQKVEADARKLDHIERIRPLIADELKKARSAFANPAEAENLAARNVKRRLAGRLGLRIINPENLDDWPGQYDYITSEFRRVWAEIVPPPKLQPAPRPASVPSAQPAPPQTSEPPQPQPRPKGTSFDM